jgi:alkanesulfonate monooxygenase SsuD/methylene tetrahydromethanopterin reductase-like flavin-dependent oxidoreductase (luciferase family)
VRLGTTVLVVPYRHPLLVARMAGNLDELSGGRLVLGSAPTGRGRSSRRSACRSPSAAG